MADIEFGRTKIKREVGGGGMSIVYPAHETHSGHVDPQLDPSTLILQQVRKYLSHSLQPTNPARPNHPSPLRLRPKHRLIRLSRRLLKAVDKRRREI